jgi:ApeA N-terminal domain 1
LRVYNEVTRGKKAPPDTIMMDELEEWKRAGTFTISPGKDVYGELTLAGPKTSLYLHDKQLNTNTISGQCVMGVLHDLTKVSLIQGIAPPGAGSVTRGNERYNFADIFPHFVVLGDHHIDPAKK